MTTAAPGKLRRVRATAASIAFAATAVLAPAFAQTPGQPGARPFDYWQPDWMVRELWGPGRMPKGMMVRLLRHTTYMQLGVQKEYEGATSTLPKNEETVRAGARLYAQNCTSCHGKDGLGDGDATLAVSPSPALLAWMVQRPIAVDPYLLWTIADGGAQFESAMPAYKDRLSRDDIWRIVAYMRAGFPAIDDAKK
jgi:mono/diheme cytochrome c family protein